MPTRVGWITRINATSALSLPAWLLISVPIILGNTTMLKVFLYDTGMAFFVSTTSWLAIGAVWLFARLLMRLAVSMENEVLWVLITIAIAGLVKGAFVFAAVDSPVKFILSALYSIIFSIFAALVVDSFRTHQAAMARLREVRRALTMASERTRRDIEMLRESTKEAVLSAVEVALGGARDRREVSLRLTRVTQEVVRPMSHELARTEPRPIEVSSRGRRGFQMRLLIDSTLESRPCHPGVVTAIVMMSIGPLLADYFRSTQMIAPIVVGSVVLLATLWLANRLPWNRLPMWLGVGLLPVVFIASGTVTYLGMSLSIPPMSGPFSGGVFSTVFLVIVGLAVALLNGAERRQPMLEERLIVANSELATALSSANAQFRRERHQLAQVLHGVVQPRLVAQAVEQSKAEGNVNIDELLDDVTALLAKAVDEPPLVNLRDALDDLQLVWSANAEITIDLSEAVDRLVSQDPTIGKAVCDVACEAVNNAVLRGGATRVDVAAAANGGDITLCVTNPMRSAVVGEISADRGLGMTLFDAVTDSWELYQGESKTVFLAHFTSSRKLTQNERVDVIR